MVVVVLLVVILVFAVVAAVVVNRLAVVVFNGSGNVGDHSGDAVDANALATQLRCLGSCCVRCCDATKQIVE